ncbi:golgin subfamily A member 6-like protein 6 [Salvia splendens]|uniref:golgin subfamily A member 6-like protein 6 n=1 Tax=Salvia splendens TaxID=180675 RepID=UPI001C26E61D|nr:golgin subfamily A member 6-like protein 6 [Salvia splendens]
MGGVGTAPSEIPPAPVSHAEEQSEEGSSSATAPLETSVPDSAELDAVAAYYDSDPEERKKRASQEETTHEGSGKTERTPTVETVSQERVREEIDLNESAQKLSLMTDTEFESIVEEVNRREDTALMAEGLDLASRSVGEVEKAVTGTTPEGHTSQSVEGKEEVHEEEKEPEPVDPRVEVGDGRMQVGEEEPGAEIQEPEPEAPPVVKPKPIKRSLILKADPKADRPKQHRVSQRCLEKWAASRDPLSTQADKEHEEEKDKVDREEMRYREERKRKGKAPMKKKSGNKKSRTVNTGIVITGAAQRTPSSQREQSDSEYEISEESESASDTSMEDEEYKEQQLPNDHQELLHPPAKRLRYKRWTDQEQRQERMEKAMEEVREENNQLKAEVMRLASVVERMLKGAAKQKLLAQRQASMEVIVTDLGKENYKMQQAMNVMLSNIDSILEEMTHQRKEQAVEPSGHGGRADEPQVPETEEKETDVPAHAEEPAEFDENQDGTEKEPPAPRRSRRHR